MAVKSRKKSWFKVCPEKWIFGSTREEMTSAERGVWMDFLALAAINDPPGQIDFFTYKRLANQLYISVKLLKSAIRKASFYGKIELKESPIKAASDENKGELNSTCDQLDTKSDILEINRSKIGLPLRTIKILKWNEYQSEYLRQMPYRKRESAEKERIEDEINQKE